MNRAFIFKIIGMLLLITLMSIAVSYVNGLILERKFRQEEAIQNVAKSYSGVQTIIGPVLVVHFTEEYPITSGTGKNKTTLFYKDKKQFFVLPEQIQLSGNFSNEYRELGIFKALTYQLGSSISGHFNLAKNINIKPERDKGTITFNDAFLSLGINDPRGISGNPMLDWNKQTVAIAQGSKVTSLGNGVHAELGKLDETAENIPFKISLNLRGMGEFNFVPVANNNALNLNSSWQSPHFGGSFLPDSKTINNKGFAAKWSVSSLGSNVQDTLLSRLNTNSLQKWDAPANAAVGAAQAATSLDVISVGFVEPINIYSQADRATKYGLLFIGLTFAGFFVFEILKQLRIHPAQYTLVGLAMALFYLLLISLSEHISFVWSYISASAACVSLLGYYLSHVLKNKMHGLAFASMLTALYGALYGILQSEDNALLMGSLMVFGLLALVMVITRKVDWYKISNKSDAPNTNYDVV